MLICSVENLRPDANCFNSQPDCQAEDDCTQANTSPVSYQVETPETPFPMLDLAYQWEGMLLLANLSNKDLHMANADVLENEEDDLASNIWTRRALKEHQATDLHTSAAEPRLAAVFSSGEIPERPCPTTLLDSNHAAPEVRTTDIPTVLNAQAPTLLHKSVQTSGLMLSDSRESLGLENGTSAPGHMQVDCTRHIVSARECMDLSFSERLVDNHTVPIPRTTKEFEAAKEDVLLHGEMWNKGIIVKVNPSGGSMRVYVSFGVGVRDFRLETLKSKHHTLIKLVDFLLSKAKFCRRSRSNRKSKSV